MTTVIAISNQKGGVAKTTTCLSLGACLAEMGKLVLVIDLDPQANLTLSMGLRPQELRYTVDDALLGNASLVSVSQETPVFGLDIVPAHRGLMLLDKVLYRKTGYEFRLRHQLEALEGGLYDVVLIDCPPSCGTLTINALTAADLLLVPTQCEYYAACSLRRVIEMVSVVRKRTNPQLVYRILVTMFDRRNRICHYILEQMERGLDGVLLDTIIEVDTKLRESPAFAEPITRYAPETRGAMQYRALAEELMNNGLHRG